MASKLRFHVEVFSPHFKFDPQGKWQSYCGTKTCDRDSAIKHATLASKSPGNTMNAFRVVDVETNETVWSNFPQ